MRLADILRRFVFEVLIDAQPHLFLQQITDERAVPTAQNADDKSLVALDEFQQVAENACVIALRHGRIIADFAVFLRQALQFLNHVDQQLGFIAEMLVKRRFANHRLFAKLRHGDIVKDWVRG